ncbi:uncharacterized protein MONBRDRAFT_13000 [Monosiga brevicollis MX1]|uniref:PID domain-containing protein n=1 Tax=Monosiga brevicollis TaxID=81824 RepID=A9VE02_MONBE|nr:uncharacterized protein MONBRDRAFT_13000 [Monosiga brevicollis MX1]EDQ84220.1 predicted protein [Monosiga brevicollis MX1]|eukprot:XP_001750944.1 hypothetical protein [Monosiga brevicollis MX1]
MFKRHEKPSVALQRAAAQHGLRLFYVKYYGHEEVPDARGNSVVDFALHSILTTKTYRKSQGWHPPQVELSVGTRGVKVTDRTTGTVFLDLPLRNISYCQDDRRGNNIFCFIAKEELSSPKRCYAFKSYNQAAEIMHVIGDAFKRAAQEHGQNGGSGNGSTSSSRFGAAGRAQSDNEVERLKRQLQEKEEETRRLKQQLTASQRRPKQQFVARQQPIRPRAWCTATDFHRHLKPDQPINSIRRIGTNPKKSPTPKTSVKAKDDNEDAFDDDFGALASARLNTSSAANSPAPSSNGAAPASFTMSQPELVPEPDAEPEEEQASTASPGVASEPEASPDSSDEEDEAQLVERINNNLDLGDGGAEAEAEPEEAAEEEEDDAEVSKLVRLCQHVWTLATPDEDGMLDGQQMRPLMMMSGLPMETLGTVWSIIDTEQLGKAQREEELDPEAVGPATPAPLLKGLKPIDDDEEDDE